MVFFLDRADAAESAGPTREGTMADSLELLTAAVLQAPREDAPRLRLADSLTAQGDPRGEFIRLQIELARPGLAEEAADQLAQRERELLAAHEAEWVAPLGDG